MGKCLDIVFEGFNIIGEYKKGESVFSNPTEVKGVEIAVSLLLGHAEQNSVGTLFMPADEKKVSKIAPLVCAF